MLRFLLDEHVSPKIADQLSAGQAGLPVVPVSRWDGGSHLGASDEEMLSLAHAQRLTLVTYDLRTITPLLKSWAEQGVAHSGVIFVDTRTYMPNDFGGLVLALEALWHRCGDEEWGDRVMHLSR